jgi:hypothetical protein
VEVNQLIKGKIMPAFDNTQTIAIHLAEMLHNDPSYFQITVSAHIFGEDRKIWSNK